MQEKRRFLFTKQEIRDAKTNIELHNRFIEGRLLLSRSKLRNDKRCDTQVKSKIQQAKLYFPEK